MMKVTTVSANIRYSQDTGHGAWKSIEIGAEASVDERERWGAALSQLYSELGSELKRLWAANGHKAPETTGNGTEGHVEPPQPVEQPIQPNDSIHHCNQHGVPFREYTRGNNRWWAHKDGANWCREGK